MVQTRSQKAQQDQEAQSSTKLEEIDKTSLQLPQQVPLRESSIEPLLQELYPEDLKNNQIQEPIIEENTKNLNILQGTYVE